MKNKYFKKALLLGVVAASATTYAQIDKVKQILTIAKNQIVAKQPAPKKAAVKMKMIDANALQPYETYCDGNANPNIIESIFNAAGATNETIVRFPASYAADKDGTIGVVTNSATLTAPLTPANQYPFLAQRPAPVVLATNNQTGAVFGLAWNEQNGDVFASAYLKRKTDLPNGTGAIYRIPNANSATPGTPVVFANLNTIFGANTTGVDPHDPILADRQQKDEGTKAQIGKVGLGDLDISPDGKLLYTVNLADRQLYIIPTTGALNTTTIKRVQIPTSIPNIDSRDVRPFGIGVDDDGTVYVGAVGSAENTMQDKDISFFVWRLDGDVFTLVFNAPQFLLFGYNEWKYWESTIDDVQNRRSPMLTDIEFVGKRMVIGVRDRYGDIIPPNFTPLQNPPFPRAKGDIFNLIPGGDLGFKPEHEYDIRNFYDDFVGDGDTEQGNGGLAVLKLPNVAPEILTSGYDPVNLMDDGSGLNDGLGNGVNGPIFSKNNNSGGIGKFNPLTGVYTGGYQPVLNENIMPGDNIPTPGRFTFGKANPVGDIEVLCEATPDVTYAVGNIVFKDSNNNGKYDTGEPLLDGIVMEIFLASNLSQPVLTQTTQNGGRYLFPDLPAGDYIVRIRPSNFQGSGPLSGYLSSTGVDNSQTSDDNLTENGIDDFNPAGQGIKSGTITLGPGMPTDASNETGLYAASDNESFRGDNRTNLTVDFGLVETVSVGSVLFKDLNNNGIHDEATEKGIAGVAIKVKSAGTDGIIGTADDFEAGSTTSGVNGEYIVSNLYQGKYYVEIPTPHPDYKASSTDITTTNGDNQTDQDDNGLQPGGPGTVVRSALIDLQPSQEPTFVFDNATNTGSGLEYGTYWWQDDFLPTRDANGDMTIDFGFYVPVGVGSTIFNDANNNGVQDATEVGIAGATVTLYEEDGVTPVAGVAPIVTTATGLYYFKDLPPGKYVVGVLPPATHPISSTDPASAAVTNGDNSTDSDDNGIQATKGAEAKSKVIMLSSEGEATTEAGIGGTQDDGSTLVDKSSDMTIDFGFYTPVSLGSTVFADNNNNGIQDAGESGLTGFVVQLYDGSGVAIGSPKLSDANGNYIFNDLAPGQYKVGVTPPAASTYKASSKDISSSSLPNNNTDGDDNGAQATIGAEALSGVIDLAAGTEPLNAAETGQGGMQDVIDADGNMTLDFGFFAPVAIGSTVFSDNNNNGNKETSEVGVVGAKVNLFNADGTPAKDATGTAIAEITTLADGKYLFSNLAPGSYIVKVTPPASHATSSTDIATSAADNQTDSDDNGKQTTIGGVAESPVIVLASGAEPIGETGTDGTIDDAVTIGDANGDMTIDFGFIPSLSLGSTVFADNNNNGKQDAGELGLADASVQLYNGMGVAIGTPIFTDASGNYIFNNLAPGQYKVGVTPAATSLYKVSSADISTSALPNNDTDGDDNGVQATAGGEALSGIIDLAAGAEPLDAAENAPGTGGAQDAVDANGNMTLDFGFFAPVAIGSTVFNDANNNGTKEASEVGIAGAKVNLFLADGTTPAKDAAGAAIPEQTTLTDGKYLFSNLAPGSYVVKVTPAPSNPVSSTDTATSGADNQTDGDDNGSQTTSGGVATSPVIVLTSGAEPTTEASSDGTADDVATIGDTNGDMTVDFGFFVPVAIGSTVFNDANNNGTKEATETGIAGAKVNLFKADGTTLATDAAGAAIPEQTTLADGKYLFSNLAPGSYVVKVTPAPAYPTSSTNIATSGADNQTDGDDNGSQTTSGGVATSPVIVLTSGAEPTTEASSDGTADDVATIGDTNGDMTVDFGFFAPVAIGSTVFNDANNNGTKEATETGILGAKVNLFKANGTTPATDAAGAAIPEQTTLADGKYLFSNLAPGSYVVKVTPAPSNPVSSTDIATSGADNQTDGDDNGSQTTSGGVATSPVIVLTSGAEPTAEPSSDGTADDAATIGDTNGDMTVDFGFFAPVAIGSTIFADANNNGTKEATETGIAGAKVNLFKADGTTPATDATGAAIPEQTTVSDGKYLFSNLAPGSYVVKVTPAPSNPVSSTDIATSDADNQVDGDDNGSQTTSGGVVTSPVIVLASGSEPTAEPSSDGTADDVATIGDTNGDMTVDFGFLSPKVSLGSTVFHDVNNNGTQDAGEVGISGATVKLYNEAGTQVGASIVSDGSGNYIFNDLAPGKYSVGVTPAASSTLKKSSTDITTTTQQDSNLDGDDNGVQSAVGGEARSGLITLSAGDEPLDANETGQGGMQDAVDADGNMTLDFGFLTDVLPLNLLNFNGSRTNQGVELTWKTANEVDFSHFDVERSTDGLEFTKIKTVKATNAGTYRLTDSKPLVGNNLYRLKMVNTNGTFTTSKVVTLAIELGTNYINLQNPVAGSQVSVSTDLVNPSFSITTMSGVKVHVETNNKGKNTYDLNYGKLSQGLYILNIQSNGKTFYKKLVVK
jgi:hypothetical protein